MGTSAASNCRIATLVSTELSMSSFSGSLAKQAVAAVARRVGHWRHATDGVPRRILVVDLDNIGDLLLATPAIRALRRRFPEAVLDALVTDYAAPVLRGNPHVNEILTCGKDIAGSPLWERAAPVWLP